MPSIKDDSTVEAIAREFTSNGRNKEQAMRTIGYAVSSCKSGKAVRDVYGNLRVKQAIARIDAESAKECKRTVQSLDAMQQAAYDLSMKINQPAAAVSASREIGKLHNLYESDQADQEVLALTKAEQEAAKEIASLILRDRLKLNRSDSA